MWQGWVLCKSLSFRSSMHLFLKGCWTVNYVFYSTEKTTEAKMMKAGGTEIGKTLAEKSRGLFSANDWQCKTYVNYKWEGSWGALLRFVTDLTHRRLSSLCNADVVMWIGRGDQSATCVTLRSMPSWKRERVRIFCIWDERAALEFFFFFIWMLVLWLLLLSLLLRLWWRFQWKGECGIHWTGGIWWWIWWGTS